MSNLVRGGRRANEQDVTGVNDMPAPVLRDGVFTIVPDDRQYVLNNDVFSDFPLASPGAGNRFTWKTINRAKWIYTGTDACFRDLDADGDIELDGPCEFQAPNGNMFELDGTGNSGSFQAESKPRFTNMLGGGTVKGIDWNVKFGTISDFDTGLDAENTTFFEVNEMFVLGRNSTITSFFRVHGNQTTGAVNFILASVSVGNLETLYDIDPDIKDSVNSILISNTQKLGAFNGTVFAPGSLDQTDPVVTAFGNASVFPDSTVKGKLEITDNSLVTDIVDQNVAVPINATWNDGTIEERLCFQDFCTFDNTTNTLTSVNDVLAGAAYNHGLSNGDTLILVEDGGLPAELVDKQEYFVINATAQTFQISLTSGGSAVVFTDDGTPNNYFCHVTGASPSGWVIYLGLQPVSIIVNGWVSISKSGSAQDANVRVIKTSATFVESDGARGGNVTVSNNIAQSSPISDIVNRSRFEGIRIFLEGRSVTPDDLIANDAVMTFNIA